MVTHVDLAGWLNKIRICYTGLDANHFPKALRRYASRLFETAQHLIVKSRIWIGPINVFAGEWGLEIVGVGRKIKEENFH